LRDVLKDETVVTTQELLVRTGTSVGSSVTIGSAEFRVAAVLKTEPDRLASGFDWGPRILMTRTGLEKAGLIQFGSRATQLPLLAVLAGQIAADITDNRESQMRR
jgi:putative ABC transport system permease protein